MSPPSLPHAAPAADAADLPPLHPDPHVAAELEFTPVPRKVNRPDGWTPALQREFIRLLAETGSPQAACVAMGKNVTGIEALYKVPSADSFRAAWDLAVKLGRERQGLDCAPPHTVQAPGIQRRSARGRAASAEAFDDDEADDMDHDTMLGMVEALALKFLRKVHAEREARLAGRIVAADFYLRQITALEVGFDLASQGASLDGWQALQDFRRGGRSWLEIAETPLSRALDDMRRDFWTEQGDPPRPEHPPERHCDPMDEDGEGRGYRREPLQEAYGALTRPAIGYTEDEWLTMDHDAQKEARAAQNAADAQAQVEWEAEARGHAGVHGEDRAQARGHARVHDEGWAEARGEPELAQGEAPVELPRMTNGRAPDMDFETAAMFRAMAIARAEHPKDFD